MLSEKFIEGIILEGKKRKKKKTKKKKTKRKISKKNYARVKTIARIAGEVGLKYLIKKR